MGDEVIGTLYDVDTSRAQSCQGSVKILGHDRFCSILHQQSAESEFDGIQASHLDTIIRGQATDHYGLDFVLMQMFGQGGKCMILVIGETTVRIDFGVGAFLDDQRDG